MPAGWAVIAPKLRQAQPRAAKSARGLGPGVRVQAPTPTGQDTPVPPIPQYPPGFLARYC